MLDELVSTIETLRARIHQHRSSLQSNEIRTRTALIDPILTVLGWDVSDPGMVTPEYDVSGKRADYALLGDQGSPIVLFEAKRLGEHLSNHRSQMVAYASELGIRYAGLTNGDDWEVYDNSLLVPIGQRRILNASLVSLAPVQCAQEFVFLWRRGLTMEQPEPKGVTPDSNESANALVTPIEDDVVLLHPPQKPLGTTLQNFQPTSGKNSAPPSVTFPDGVQRSPRRWNELLVEVFEWLIRSGRLTPRDCPMRLGNSRYIVDTQAVHSNGQGFKQPRQLSNGLYLEANLTASEMINICRDSTEQLGDDPSRIQLQEC